MYDFMFWSGVSAWIASGVIGIFFLLDWIADRVIDSAKFKAFVIRYLADKKKQRLGS